MNLTTGHWEVSYEAATPVQEAVGAPPTDSSTLDSSPAGQRLDGMGYRGDAGIGDSTGLARRVGYREHPSFARLGIERWEGKPTRGGHHSVPVAVDVGRCSSRRLEASEDRRSWKYPAERRTSIQGASETVSWGLPRAEPFACTTSFVLEVTAGRCWRGRRRRRTLATEVRTRKRVRNLAPTLAAGESIKSVIPVRLIKERELPTGSICLSRNSLAGTGRSVSAGRVGIVRKANWTESRMGQASRWKDIAYHGEFSVAVQIPQIGIVA